MASQKINGEGRNRSTDGTLENMAHQRASDLEFHLTPYPKRTPKGLKSSL